jgi:hypothetical protein
MEGNKDIGLLALLLTVQILTFRSLKKYTMKNKLKLNGFKYYARELAQKIGFLAKR